MLRRFAGVLFALAVMVGGMTLLSPSAPVAAETVKTAPAPGENADGCSLLGQTVICHGTNPGDPPVNPVTGLTPEPPKCIWDEAPALAATNEIECYDQYLGWWSNNRQCYLKDIAETPYPSPPNANPTGMWYTCGPYDCRALCWSTVWLDTPPPGETRITPGAAAYELLEIIPLAPITIGLAPDPNVAGSRSYVGVPIWMWANEPTAETYGALDVNETLGGINITATARVTSIVWTMGDGSTVACATAGTPYQPSMGFAASPNCGYRYTTVSTGQPGGKFPITATSQWTMDWAVGDVTGTLNTTRTANTAVEIRELQSVNVGN